MRPAAHGASIAARVAPAATITDEVVRSVEPVLYGFAMRAVRSDALARDLVQETFVAVLEGRSSFDGRSTLRTWMVGILGRKIVDHYRRTRREVLTDIPPEPEPLDAFAPPGSGTEARVDRKAALRVIEQSLGRLSELERMAVLLCDVEQMDRAAACEVLGVEAVHLRVLLHRGRHRLRKALEDAGM